MLNIHNLTISFSGEELFSDITFKVNAGDRAGLVGKNGAGKSTLLRILAGEQEYDQGNIAFEKEISIGFLKQEIDFIQGRTVIEEAYEAFEEIRDIEKKLEEIHKSLEVRTDYESDSYQELLHDLDDLTHRYDVLGGYHYQGETEKVLQGLGFERKDFENLTDTFSGGWRMRIELAKLLLQKHDVLLLDEPTNHLDIESIIWFENFLKSFPGAVILVSHDKMFLDNVTNRTIEISMGQIYDFKKPYSEYLLLRNEIREKQLQSQKNQEREIRHTEQLIEKFRAKANKASMAQSLIKKLNKVQRIEVDTEDHSSINIRFDVSVVPGKIVIEAENVGKSYGDHVVLENVNLLIERGAKIAFVGQNGQGKTTLAKIIVDEIPYVGNLQLGHNVDLGYFAQNQSDYLDGELTILETMEMAANDHNRPKVRDMLGAFLFRGDDVEKKVKVLSGGEKNRLALCKMLLHPLNVLVMDEPTNHLDIVSKNVLKQALQNFEGTLIVVSHDRDFLQGLTQKVYAFKDRKIKEYLGDINYFLEQHDLENLREIEKRTAVVQENSREKGAGKRGEEKRRKQLQNKLKKIEDQISKLEKEIAKDDKIIAEDFDKIAEDQDFFKKYQLKKDKVDELMFVWEELHESI
jgi:ATP-binding cassette subfamily F protein 3